MKRLVAGTVAATLSIMPLAGSFAFAIPAWANDSVASQAVVASSETPQTALAWSLDPQTKKGGEVLEKDSGWYHFKASDKNGNAANNPSKYPAVAINNKEYNFADSGNFATTIRTKEDGTKNRFGFYLGYKDPGNGLFIGFDSGGWFWQTYSNGNGDWFKGNRLPAPKAGEKTEINIHWAEGKAILLVNKQIAFTVDYNSIKNNLSKKLAMKAGAYNSELTDVEIKDPDAPSQTYKISGKVIGDNSSAINDARVQLDDKVIRTKDDGAFEFSGLELGKHKLSIVAAGYDEFEKDIKLDGSDVKLDNITLKKSSVFETEKLQTEDMDVVLHKNFPAVSYYTMKKLENHVMDAQSNNIHTVSINGTNVELKDSDVQFTKVSDTEAQYVLSVKDAGHNIDAKISVTITVKKNQLHFDVTKIENKAGEQNPVQTLYFPENNLVSVNSSQEGATFTGARMSSNTQIPGDKTFAITDGYTLKDNGDYTYGFVSNNQLSAGLWSNSEHNGTVAYSGIEGGSKNTRVIASAKQESKGTQFGLTSAPWYYHRIVSDSKGNKYTVGETDMPKSAVVISGDENNDGVITWQDGAIAYRDIMNNPYKCEEVPELVAWRIAMNFGSQAQNPFLTTLDNVKKVALNTDGLGQSVLLKGYGNEGHDSGHPDYGDINKRAGGASDMNTLMEKGKKYGARFGVHVNASEMYPEAKAFSEQMVRRNGKSGSLRYGWNWLDQGIGIDGIYDLASNSRKNRFGDLKKEVKDNMDFIYLDVWGNQTSGAEDSWETRKMSKMINDNKWRMTTEWGAGNEYDSTFQHWAADLAYGGFKMKGENSQVMRFLRNHQKDSWVGDFPSYGGAANAPLLGGYNMKDFEGWQGRNDYDAYISNLFTHDLSTKFIQHFKVVRWVNSPLDASSVRDPKTNNSNEQIDLADANGNKLVISRGSNDSSSSEYRNRTIKLNDKIVASGAVSAGDSGQGGTESYLLPWLWDVNSGKLVKDSDQKLYHWNTKGGSTTWTLPKGWENLQNVTVYKLTDLGKTDRTVVNVANGKVTLNAKAETPYVIYKGSVDAKQLNVTWSEGMHVVDAGFNGGEESLSKNWNSVGAGKASIAKSQFSNPMLKLSGKVKVSQKITDLKPGKHYALYVGVDNRSSAPARMTVRSGDKVLATNETMRSIAKNYVKAYTHNTNSATVDGSSYFQNMYVFFTAPENGEATLELEHSGEGDTYFDDVRVVENEYTGLKFNNKGEVTGLDNDFEHNAQGIWPFVIGGTEGVEDNRIHLSEKHAPFTQAGWDVKKVDDVLGGDWSVKVNGLVGRDNLLYRTVPQNFEFKPGHKYTVEFDYQAGSKDTYAVVTGEGEFNGSVLSNDPLDKAEGTTAHHKFTVIGGANGDTWFGIYSTDKDATLPSGVTSNDEANFGGYRDFILDNLKIREEKLDAVTREQAKAKYDAIKQKWDAKCEKFIDQVQKSYAEQLSRIHAIIEKSDATSDDFAQAVNMLDVLDAFMSNAPVDNASDKYDVARNAYSIEVGSYQPRSDNEGPAELANDDDPGTWWHTVWGGNAVQDGTAWFEFTLNKPMTINGLRYLPRNGGGVNGKIKSYKITITKADNTIVEKSGEFKASSSWQKADFGEDIQNVKKVRITVLTSAGNPANTFASAAELRLTTPKTPAPVVPPAPKPGPVTPKPGPVTPEPPAPVVPTPTPQPPAPAPAPAPAPTPAPSKTPAPQAPVASAPAAPAPKSVKSLEPELKNTLTVGNNNVATAGVANKVILNISDNEFIEKLKSDGVVYAYAYIYSNPRLLKSTDGSKYVTVRMVDGKPEFNALFPSDYSGKHTVVLVDETGKQIAWTNITVKNTVKKQVKNNSESKRAKRNLTNTGVNVLSILMLCVLAFAVACALRKLRAN